MQKQKKHAVIGEMTSPVAGDSASQFSFLYACMHAKSL